jgi:hypothetical protein
MYRNCRIRLRHQHGIEIRRYLARGQSLTRVREWLEAHVAEVSASDDDGLRDLDDLAWSLISECDEGVRTESEVWQALVVGYPDLAPTTNVAHPRPDRDHERILAGD